MPTNPFKLKTLAESLAASQGFAAIPDGKQDALRHVIGSALFARSYGRFLAWVVGESMELASWIVRHNSSAQRAMDRHNNAVGREIALRARSNEEVVRLALDAIETRTARWLIDGDGPR